MRDLVLVVPSRGRPENIARLHYAMQATCRGDTTLVVGLDDDDPSLEDYKALHKAQGWEMVIRPGLRSVVPWMNELAVPRAPEYRFIGQIGDDNVPLTDGWDTRIMGALEQAPFAFGNDLYPRPPGSLCCHVFCRSQVVSSLGYLGPPSIRHMYVDVVWMAWGIAAGIIYLHDVIIEHRHPTIGKTTWDDSYLASQSLVPADLEAYLAYCQDQLNTDITRISPTAVPFTAEKLARFNGGLSRPQ